VVISQNTGAAQAAILGIDVGLDGAFAFYRDGRWTLVDMPTVGDGKKQQRRVINCPAVDALLREHAPIEHAYIEHASSMPKQGVASMFSFGRTFGALEMALVANGIPYTIVTAQAWKKLAGIPTGADKESSRRRALQLFQDQATALARRKDHARADALLLAHFGPKLHERAPSINQTVAERP
jgi:crossover junction endodeoxyribonuclease RuvC